MYKPKQFPKLCFLRQFKCFIDTESDRAGFGFFRVPVSLLYWEVSRKKTFSLQGSRSRVCTMLSLPDNNNTWKSFSRKHRRFIEMIGMCVGQIATETDLEEVEVYRPSYDYTGETTNGVGWLSQILMGLLKWWDRFPSFSEVTHAWKDARNPTSR